MTLTTENIHIYRVFKSDMHIYFFLITNLDDEYARSRHVERNYP